MRPDSTPQTLAKPAGNASRQNDAAAAYPVAAEDKLGAPGPEPLGYPAGRAAAGGKPVIMGVGLFEAAEEGASQLH